MGKRAKRRAKFGLAWWGRGAHFSLQQGDGTLTTYGEDPATGLVFAWPRPCTGCVEEF